MNYAKDTEEEYINNICRTVTNTLESVNNAMDNYKILLTNQRIYEIEYLFLLKDEYNYSNELLVEVQEIDYSLIYNGDYINVLKLNMQ